MRSEHHKKEEWLGLLKDKMSSHREPVPEGRWAALEQALANRKISPLRRRWPRLIAAVSATAAVMLLCLILFPISSPVQTPEKPQLAQVTPVTPVKKLIGKRLHPTDPPQKENGTRVIEPQPLLNDTLIAGDSVPNRILLAEHQPTQIIKEENALNGAKRDLVKHEQSDLANKEGAQARTWEEYLNQEAESLDAPKKNDHWLALSVGNSGVGTFDPRMAEAAVSMPLPQMAPTQLEGGVKDLMLYKRPEKLEISSRAEAIVLKYRHKQPLSFGVRFGKTFSDRFTLETGLVYSLLRSDVGNLQKDKTLRQTLHYVGIPLRFNWNFVHRQKFAVYTGIGGMVEKCVYGELDNKEVKIKSVQTSLNLSVGAQYKFSPVVAIYFEPGLSYYLGMKEDGSLGEFDNGTLIKSIHSENPLGFTLQAGFRFSF